MESTIDQIPPLPPVYYSPLFALIRIHSKISRFIGTLYIDPPYPLAERLEKTRLFMSLTSRQSHGRDLR